MIKIAIIGASGFIGSALYNFLSKKEKSLIGTCFSNSANTELENLDITQSNQLQEFLIKNEPEFLIWAAGSKDVKKCERDYDFAYRINSQPIKDLVGIVNSAGLNTKIIYLSTDYVFEGDKGYYESNDIPNPLTNYGKTKLFSEKILQNSQSDYKIIRTSAVMGRGSLFFTWLLNELEKTKKIALFSNTYFTPTPVKFLTEMIHLVIDNYEATSDAILHIPGEKRMNRYEFAGLVKELDKKFIANIEPQEIDLFISSTYFQRDLSLIQSSIIKKYQKRSLEDYLREEVRND